ncbi:hypothetical protein ACFLUG_04000 [Chloroflexota bacterium]
MDNAGCEICGRNEVAGLDNYPVVPPEVADQAGILQMNRVQLCPDCKKGLDIWYSAKITDTEYNEQAKHFAPKPAWKMVKEYETAFRWFTVIRKGYRED